MDFATTFEYTVRVYAENVDFMGIVYHANYLCYFEQARTDMLRKNSMILSDLMERDILFAIREAHIFYKAPAKLDDLLLIKTKVQKLGACSFSFDQLMQNEEKKILCEAKIQVVCVNSKLRPRRFSLENLGTGDK